jgi:hypothetical protein
LCDNTCHQFACNAHAQLFQFSGGMRGRPMMW